MAQTHRKEFTLTGPFWTAIRWGIAGASYTLVGLMFWFSIGDHIRSMTRMIPVDATLEYIELKRTNAGVRGSGGIELRTLYNFEYRGKKYTGTHAVLGSEWALNGVGTDYELHDLVYALRKEQGSTIKVWVDPHRPNVSSIKKRIHKSTVWLFGALSLFGLVAITRLNQPLVRLFQYDKGNA